MSEKDGEMSDKVASERRRSKTSSEIVQVAKISNFSETSNTNENIATGVKLNVQLNVGCGMKVWQVSGKVSRQAKYYNWRKGMVADR